MPAALPSFVSGLKQGWAFAWHGLLAGELLVIVPNLPSIGVLLQSDQDQTDMAGVIAIMIVILVLGVLVDTLLNTLNESLRRRRGLTQAPSTAKGWRLATGVAR
jgi:NitT/TauT family transport system permease protein